MVAASMPGRMPGRPGQIELPPEVEPRVDRIVNSEILGPVMRPQPMALLGIVGERIILRAPSGQTGLIQEGETLGGIKLLKIGINRILIEEEGQEKELMIFSGFGGSTLISTTKTNL